jgi:hypothetical protein
MKSGIVLFQTPLELKYAKVFLNSFVNYLHGHYCNSTIENHKFLVE